MKTLVLSTLLVFLTFTSKAQRTFTDAVDIIKIEAKKESLSKVKKQGIDPENISANDVINSNGNITFDYNSCFRIENTTEHTLLLYLNRKIYAILPPFAIMDAVPKADSNLNEFYAVSRLNSGPSLTWGPWVDRRESCKLVLLEKKD